MHVKFRTDYPVRINYIKIRFEKSGFFIIFASL